MVVSGSVRSSGVVSPGPKRVRTFRGAATGRVLTSTEARSWPGLAWTCSMAWTSWPAGTAFSIFFARSDAPNSARLT